MTETPYPHDSTTAPDGDKEQPTGPPVTEEEDGTPIENPSG